MSETVEKPKAHPMEQFGLFVAFLVGMLILIDPAARDITGKLVGAVLEPLVGFNHALPALTLLLASVVMVLTNSGVRHYFTDYLQQARNQEVMKAFNKEMRDARKENNLHKIKRLTDANKDLMKVQAEQSTAQLKPMALTMVVVVPIFAWLLTYVDPGAAAPEVIADPVATVPAEALAGDYPSVSQARAQLGTPVAFGSPAERSRVQVLFAGKVPGVLAIADNATGTATVFRAQADFVGGNLTLSSPGTVWSVDASQLRAQGYPGLAAALESPGQGTRATTGEGSNLQGQLTSRGTSFVHAGPRVFLVRHHNPGAESVMRVPWEPSWELDINVQAKVPPFEWFPRWVAIYTLFSIPLGQVVAKTLKARDLRQELAKAQGA